MNLTDPDAFTLVHILKGGAFAAVAVVFASAVARQWSARALSLYWRIVVVGLLVLPLIGIYGPEIPLLSRATAMLPAVAGEETSSVMTPVASGPVELSSAAAVASASPTWLLWVWLGGALLILARWGIARVAVARLCRGAEPAAVMDSGGAKVFVSPDVRLPMAPDLFGSTVLLPSDSTTWSAAKREAVITHERSHGKRRDALFLFVSQLAIALHWINPFAWIVARKLRMADERSADDSVLAAGADGASYATLLLEFAKGGGSSTLAAPAMAHRSNVGTRVERVLDVSQRRGAPGGVAWGAGAALVFAVASVVGAITTEDAAGQVDSVTVAEKMKQITIPRIAFDDTGLDEAIDFLRLLAAENDTTETNPGRKGVPVVVRGDLARPGGRMPKLSLSLTDVRLADAFKYVAQLGGVAFRIENEQVVIGRELPAVATTPESSPAKAANDPRLKTIVFSKVEFAATPLAEVVEFLRSKTAELDSPERPAGARGFNVLIESSPTANLSDSPVTLNLDNVPLGVVVQLVSESAGVSVEMRPYAIVFTPQGTGVAEE